MLAYLDGSGDTSNGRAAQRVVTLASIAAYKTAWDLDLFTVQWDDLVRQNGGEPIHATTLHSTGSYDILERAVGVVASLVRPSFHVFGCALDLADYSRVLPLSPSLQLPQHDDRPKPPEAICVDWCVGGLFDRMDIDVDDPLTADIGLVFDRNEEFLHWIYRVWTAPFQKRPWWARKRRRGAFPDARIATIVPGDSDSYRELQAADVVAWVLTRRWTHGDRNDWYAAITAGREGDFMRYDYDALSKAFVPQ